MKKAVDTYPSAIQFVSDWYKTQQMCVKAVETCPFVFDSALKWYTTQEMSDKVFF